MNEQELNQLEQKVNVLEKKLEALQSEEPSMMEAALKNDTKTIDDIASDKQFANYFLYFLIGLMILASFAPLFKKVSDLDRIWAKLEEEIKHESSK